MAEELLTTEQDINPDALNPAQNIPDDTKTTIKQNLQIEYKVPLDAKPEAIDIYKNIVGNPSTGSNPFASSPYSDVGSAAQQVAAINKKMQFGSDNLYSRMRPFTYNGDYDGANFQRYYGTDAYETLGFSPYRDNESLYNEKMTMGDQFVRAASQWDNLALTGFKSGIRAWGTLFTDPLAPDVESAREMERAMAIGNSTMGGVGGFAINTFLNSAYTIGIAADFLAEEVALAAVTAFTGGLAGEATLPGMAGKAGLAARSFMKLGEVGAKIGKTADKFAEGAKLSAKLGELAEKTDDVFGGVSSARQFFNKVANGTIDVLNPFENSLRNIKRTDYATDLAKTIGVAGGFIDDVIQIKTGVSEAKLEAGMVKIDATKQLIDQYRQAHDGKDPEGEDLQKIETIVNEEARRTALWNLPAIMTTNKLLFSTIMLPVGKLIGRTGTAQARMLEKIAAKGPMKAKVVDPYEIVGTGAGSQLKAVARSFKNPRLYGQYARNYMKANVAEGLQENIQEAISQGAIRHALDVQSDPRMGAYQGYMGHFLQGMKDQISPQGAETFASGFAMGMFVQPVMSVPAWSIAKLSDLAKGKKSIAEAKAERDRLLGFQKAALNDVANNDVLYWGADIGLAVRNGSLSDDLFHAARVGDHKGAQDAKDNINYNHVKVALASGKFPELMDKLADYKNLTPKEALEAFKRYDIGITTEAEASKALGYIDDVIRRANKIKENYEEVTQMLPNPHTPNKYTYGTNAHTASTNAYRAWEGAKDNLIFARTTFQNYAERVASMAEAFSSISSDIAKADSQSLNAVLTLPNIKNEIKVLKQEIKSLGEIPEQASIKKGKEKTLEYLENFQDSILSVHEKIAANPTMPYLEKQQLYGEAKKDFARYMQHFAKKNDSIVFDTVTDKAFSLLTDSLEMKKDMQGLAISINALSNPDGFLNLQNRMAEAYEKNIPERSKIINRNLDIFMTMHDENQVLGELGKMGLKLPENFIEAYKKALTEGKPLPVPAYFFDPQTDEKIYQANDPERFEESLDLWVTFMEWMKRQSPETQTEEIKTTTTEPLKFDAKVYETYPDELKVIIQKLYDDAIASGTTAKEVSIEEFAQTNLLALNEVEQFKIDYKEKQDLNATKSFEEYKSLSAEDLNILLQIALEKEKTDLSVSPERKRIQEALAYRQRADVKITPEAQAAIDKIIEIKKKVVNKDNDQKKYIIDGDTKDFRATGLTDKAIDENIDEATKFAYAYTITGEPTPLLNVYKEALENNDLVDVDPKKYAENLMGYFKKNAPKALTVKDLETFNKQFDKRKFDAIEAELAVGAKDEAAFAKLLDKYVYEEATIRGNTLDSMGRNFFEGLELDPADYYMTPEAFEQARAIFIEINNDIAERGEVILTNGLVVYGDTILTEDGRTLTAAGELDLLVVDKDGKYKIVDMKTANKWAGFGNVTDTYFKKPRYSLQLGIYKNLLENMTGIKVDDRVRLVALLTEQDLDGKITRVTRPPQVIGKEDIDLNEPQLVYGDQTLNIKDIINKYIPSNLEHPGSIKEKEIKDSTTPPVVEEVIKKKKPAFKMEDLKGYTQKMPGGRIVNFNPETRKWEVRTKSGKLITNKTTLKNLVTDLSELPGIIPIWWTNFLTEDERFRVNDALKDLENLYREGQEEAEPDQYLPSDRLLLMEALNGAKFKRDTKNSITKDVPDVNSVWLSPAGSNEGYDSADRFVINNLRSTYESYGMIMPEDTQDLINDVYDMINEYPKGINQKRIDEYRKSLNPNTDIFELKDAFAEEFGLDIERVFFKLQSSESSETEDDGLDDEPDTEESFVDSFNADSIPAKFNYIVTELKNGAELTGTLTSDYPAAQEKLYRPEAQVYQVTLDDGRKLKVTSEYHFNKTINMDVYRAQPRLSLKLIKFENKGVIEDAIEVRLDAYPDKHLTYVRKTPFDAPISNNTAKIETTDPVDFTLEQINKDKNVNTLTQAMAKGYDAVYNNTSYTITKVTEKNVTLTSLNSEAVTVNHDQISEINDGKGVVKTGDDIDMSKSNQEIIAKTPLKLDENLTIEEAREKIRKNKCK